MRELLRQAFGCDRNSFTTLRGPDVEQAIKQYMGKDASEEWNTIHKPGTVEKYATTDTGPKILGPVKGGGGAVAAAPARKGREDPPPIEGDGGIAGWPGAAKIHHRLRAMAVSLAG